MSAQRIKTSLLFNKVKWIPLMIVIIQTILGILTALTSVNIRATKWNAFEWMAQLHQFVAMLLLLSLAFAAYLNHKESIKRMRKH
jgi:cytochrome c oxidase assembly protein subunit 15